jgi:hypothetical protein
MTVVERMGGKLERRLEGLASAWKATDLADFEYDRDRMDGESSQVQGDRERTTPNSMVRN